MESLAALVRGAAPLPAAAEPEAAASPGSLAPPAVEPEEAESLFLLLEDELSSCCVRREPRSTSCCLSGIRKGCLLLRSLGQLL